ncbi:DUF4189 domain-containing protein [Roseibium album]|uniref:DUF4189 domain-containing protein n=1 Tax=Roseibium album TaxID=311410 RepID=UPI0032EE0F00
MEASERSKKVCANRETDKSVQKGYFAFAISTDREHCGWSWGRDSIKHAELTALKSCSKFKGLNCKVVHSGCNPYFTNTCGK